MELLVYSLSNKIVLLMQFVAFTQCQVLEPPYFDIAKGKRIEATATCGYDVPVEARRTGDGEKEGELYCLLTGVPGKFGIHGQYCSYCSPDEDHSITYANDGSTKFWMSPPLSRGLQYEEVNVTLHLGQTYHVAYVIIKTGNSPRPGVWSLLKSNDNGKTFTPWQHFASSPSECVQHFGMSPYLPLIRDDTVICTTEYSQVPPFEDGEIHISLVNDRPGAANFSYSPVLQEWTSATHVRLQFLRVKTLLGDLMPLSLKDPTVTRRYYYSLKDISVGGRCMCNGFADNCKPVPSDPLSFKCDCQYNADGSRCERCKEGYVQKKWRPRRGNDTFTCEKCNCHGHSNSCEYSEVAAQRKLSRDLSGKYEGGGVCRKCQHNTYGINCERCRPFYYRPKDVPITDKRVCQPCNCSTRYSTGMCADGTGQCQCKPKFTGRYCDRCNKGYYGFPECKPCECNKYGSIDGSCKKDLKGICKCRTGYTGKVCDECDLRYTGFPNCKPCGCNVKNGAFNNVCRPDNGQCQCRAGYKGLNCDQCDLGYHGYPNVKVRCDCDNTKTTNQVCSLTSGRCLCIPKYDGINCQKCANGYYRYPECLECSCSTLGSILRSCNAFSGKCRCKANYIGQRCDQCGFGSYGYPNCLPCDCDRTGSYGADCRSSDGQCTCKSPYAGRRCNRCQPGSYGFPDCRTCNCNPAGVRVRFGGCNTASNGQCTCKDNVQGIVCNECREGTFNLDAKNPKGCERCDCFRPGTSSGILSCSQASGRCNCKASVESRRCRVCKRGFFNLEEANLFGCEDCRCDFGGSEGVSCNPATGQCKCRKNISGRRCNRALQGYYFPSLHHFTAEMEDGRTPEGNQVLFDYQDSKFPGFSWKGFIEATAFQLSPVLVTVSFFKNGHRENDQFFGTLIFPSTQTGNGSSAKYVTLGEGVNERFFSLNAGKWDIQVIVPKSELLLDKLVLIPVEYDDARQLKMLPREPCEVKETQTSCSQYAYLRVYRPGFIITEAETMSGADSKPIDLFKDEKVLRELDLSGMALLSPKKNQLNLNFDVGESGKYIFLVQYFHDADELKYFDFYLRTYEGSQRGKVHMYSCRYKFGCRSVAVDQNNAVKIFNVEVSKSMLMTLISRLDAVVGVDSIIAIPLEHWKMDYITPSLLCFTKDGKCLPTKYEITKGAVLVDPKPSPGTPRPPNVLDPAISLSITPIDAGIVQPGRYHIIAHYYQPTHPSFDTEVSVDNVRSYPGVASFNYCPNVGGCRALVKDQSGLNIFTVEIQGTTVRLSTPTEKDLWIDYLLFVPSSSYIDELLEQSPISIAEDFRSKCSKENFVIKPSVKGFCRDGTFSLTTAFNDGALPCNCSRVGSKNMLCEEFGGQCPCKENIIGRMCNHCRLGYYGFPDCRSCGCPNCDEVTGQCHCPPGVNGDKCTQCEPGTFGYDPVLGCQSCNCSLIGTVDGKQECNPATGQCSCKMNFAGRYCASCKVGYFGYPQCKKCDCNEAGITLEKCDNLYGKCICKNNVTGPKCSDCIDGYFRTSDPAASGLCLRCWCSERTNKCNEARLYRTFVSKMTDWNVTHPSQAALSYVSPNSIVVNFNAKNHSKNVYAIASKKYLGHMVTSYGGKLSFYVKYELTSNANESPYVILKSQDKEIVSKNSFELQNGRTTRVEIYLKVNSWENDDGSDSTREDILRVLSKLDALLIKVSLDESTVSATLTDVRLAATLRIGSEPVSSVEQCFCPPQYTGFSCEQCATGYTRNWNGTCSKCECNGKAENCDPEIGTCINCRDNFTGDRCDKCKPGHYGDKCKPCECPLPVASNNFASSCALVDSRIVVCTCKEGYAGAKCERCSDGYYGDPQQIGDSCKPCKCNGNIDTRLTDNCDSRTGVCFKCINNTDGKQCEHCRRGYYGDAIVAKNCTNCNCDLCGSKGLDCDSKQGTCTCKENVIGVRCDECKPNTWNFKTCVGCELCDCDEGAENNLCDVKTGQCHCKEGVTGRRCDWCKIGYFNFSSNGCQACNCSDGGYCDVITGNCNCGLNGEDCTLCQNGSVLTKNGCQKCNKCVYRLLKRIQNVNTNVTSQLNQIKVLTVRTLSTDPLKPSEAAIERPEKESLSFKVFLETIQKAVGFGHYGHYSGDLGYHTVSEFKNYTFRNAKSMTTSAKPTEATTTEPESIINRRRRDIKKHQFARKALQAPPTPLPKTSDVCPASLTRVINETVLMFTNESKILKETFDLGRNVSSSAYSTFEGAADILKILKKGMREVKEAVMFTNETLGKLQTGSLDTNVSVTIAEKRLAELRMGNFSETLGLSKQEKTLAKNISALATMLIENTTDIIMSANSLKRILDDITKTISQQEKSENAVKGRLTTANGIVFLSALIDLQLLTDTATELAANKNKTLEGYKMLVDKARSSLKDAKILSKIFEGNRSALSTLMDKLRPRLKLISDGNIKAVPIVASGDKHADYLKTQSDILETLIQDTKEFSRASVRAAKVYSKAINGIRHDLRIAEKANTTAFEAQEKIGLLDKEVNESHSDSKRLVEEIKEQENGLNSKVTAPFNQLEDDLIAIRGMKDEIMTRMKRLRGKSREYDALEKQGKNSSEETKRKSQEALDKIIRTKEYAFDTKDMIKQGTRNITSMSKTIIKVNKLVEESAHNVTETDQEIPKLVTKLELVNNTYNRIQDFNTTNITLTLASVGYKIEHARSIANQALLVMKFNGSSYLSLRPSKELLEQTRTNEIELFIRTEKSEGFVTFIGDSSESNPRNDFLGLELNGGKLSFYFNVNESFVANVTNERIIEPKQWYKITAARKIDTAELTVVSEGGARTEAVYNSPSKMNLLSLDSKSDIIVGGLPPGRKLPTIMEQNYKPLNSCVDGLTFNGKRFGFWNWRESKHLYACDQRDAFVTSLTAYRFYGDGFIKFQMARFQNLLRRIKFSFRTLEKDGLLMLGYHTQIPGAFTSLELKDGKLVLRYFLENGYKELSSSLTYNDGQLHVITKTRKVLKVDGVSLANLEKEGSGYDANTIFIGGVPFGAAMRHNAISTQGFTGCILDISFYQRLVPSTITDFKSYSESCNDFVARGAAFLAPHAFVFFKCTLSKGGGISFSFQTYQKDAVLFHVQGGTNAEVALSIVLLDGILQVNLKSGPERATVSAKGGEFNDGKWHSLRLDIESDKLVVVVDDNMQSKLLTAFDTQKLGELAYLGGVPKSMSAAMPLKGIQGNIKDVFCGSSEIDFNAGWQKMNVTLCTRNFPPPITPLLPTKAPIIPQLTAKPATALTMTAALSTREEATKTPTSETSITTTTLTTTIEASAATTEASSPAAEPSATTKSPTATAQTIPTTEIASTEATTVETQDTEALTTKISTAEATIQRAPTSEPLTTKPSTAQTTTTEGATTKTIVTDPATGEVIAREATTTEAITTEPTTTRSNESATPSVEKCTLPVEPNGRGFGFGLKPKSYVEIQTKPSEWGTKSTVQFAFSTFAENGILFTSGTGLTFDFEHVYLSKGLVVYVFNAGAGSLYLQSTKQYNDGKFHKVLFRRNMLEATLAVDTETLTGKNKPSASTVNSYKRVLFGGISDILDVPKLPESSATSVKGCITDIRLFGKVPTSILEKGATGCFGGNMLRALFFANGDGYAVYREPKFYVGIAKEITVTLRPRSPEGLVFFVGSSDFLALELLNGKAIAYMNNGGGIVKAEAQLAKVCDGGIYDITIKKEGVKLTLTTPVGSASDSLPGRGVSADTNTPLYLGGVPGSLKGKLSGVKGTSSYHGCIVDLKINGKSVMKEKIKVFGAAMIGCQGLEP